MAQTIKIKRSSTSGNKLTSSNSVAGELGLNTADKALYIQTGSTNGDVVTIAHESTLKIDEVNGRIGIGTTSPSEKLTVNGNISVSGTITTSGNIVVNSNSALLAARKIAARDTNGLAIATSDGTERIGILNSGAVRFNNAFTFPTAIGSAGQVLKVPTSGTTLYWANEAAVSAGTSLSDADGDTKIQVEETADEDRIRFDTAGTQRMVVDSTGLTIGSATDTTTLEFPDKTGIPDSPTETNDKVQLIKMGQGGNGGMWQTTGRGGMLISSADDSLVLANGDAGRFYDPNAGGHHPAVANETLALLSDFDIRFTTGLQDGWSGGSTYSPKTSVITAEGRFGIGTTSPDTNLDITSGGVQGLLLNQDSSDSSASSRIFLKSAQRINTILNVSGNTEFRTGATIGSSSGTVRFAINGSTGNVGIGTTSPGRKLTVQGASGDNLPVRIIGGSGTSHGSVEFQDPNTTADYKVAVGSKGDDFYIQAGGGEKVRVKSDGNVGINTTSPEAKLHNIGHSRLDGAMLQKSNLSIGSGNISTGNEYISHNGPILTNGSTGNINQYGYFRGYQAVYGTDGTNGYNPYAQGSYSNPVFEFISNNRGSISLPTDAAIRNGYLYQFVLGNSGSGGTNSGVELTSSNTTLLWGITSSNHAYFANRVGIGASTPGYKLEVLDSDGGTLANFRDTDSSHNGIIIAGDINAGWVGNDPLATGEGIYYQNSLNAMRFYTNSAERMRIDSSGQVGIGTTTPGARLEIKGTTSDSSAEALNVRDSSNNQLFRVQNDGVVVIGDNYLYVSAGAGAYFDGTVRFRNGITDDTGQLSLNSSTGDITFNSCDLESVGNITTSGYLRGPSTFTIDPATHGDDTGTVVIAGNLQVDGTTTTINSTTLTVDDLNITLASGAVNAAAANGAGITVDTAGAQLTYDATQDRWNMNKGLELIGTPLVVGTGATDIGRVESSSGVFSLTAYTTREIAFGNDTNGEHVRIDTDGNVGIGTNSPEKPLHVTGQGKFEGRVTIEDNAVPLMFNQADQSNGTVGKWWRMPVDGTSLRFDVSLTNDDAFSTYRDVLSLTTSGEAQVHGKLAVNNRSATAYVDSVVPDGSALSLRLGRADESSYWDFNHAGNDLRIYNNDGSGSNVLIGLNAGGGLLDNKVGIGTATPTQKLDVAGIIKTGGIAHPEIELVPSGSVGNADIRFDGTSFDIRSNSSSAYLTLQTSTTERLKITSTGNFEFNNGNFTEVGTVSSGAITSSGNLLISKTDPTITLFDNSGANTNPNGTIIFSEVSGTNNFKINYNGANDRLEFRGLIGTTDTEIVRINRGTDPALHIFGRQHLEYSVQATANKAYGLVVRGNDSGSTGEAASIFLGGIHNTVRGVYLAAEIQSASNDHDLIIATSGPSAQPSERMRITGDGKVGIGQSLPSAKLHVKDASFPQLKLEDADDTMEIGYSGTNFYFKRNDNDGSITFRRADNSDVMSVAMSTKRVGIGTASPTYGLQVVNNQTSQSATGTMYVQASLNGSGKGLVIDSNTRTTSDNSVAALETITRANTTGLKVQVDGNVGIGTSDPLAKLQVEALGIDTTTTTTSATTEATIDSFAAATFRSARYTIQVTNTTDSTYHMTEILLIHNGTTPNITEYGTVFTGTAAEATFDADISSGSVRLRATPASADSMTFKVVRHCITV